MKKLPLVTTVLLLLPAGAGAEQFEYGTKAGLTWTDNVFSTPDDATVQVTKNNELVERDDPREADFSVRVSPWGRLSDPDGDLTWSLRYQPSYEAYFQQTDLSGFDHDANGDISWRVGERTTLFASEQYQQYRSLVRFNQNTNQVTNQADFQGKRDKIVGNLLTGGMRHYLTPRDVWAVSGSYNLHNYTDQSSTDRWSYALGTNLQHNLTDRTVVGASASWIRQEFERTIGNNQVTNYYNISGVLEHHFSRTLSLEISAGPTLIDGDDTVANFSSQFGVGLAGLPGGQVTVGIDANTCDVLNDALPVQEDPTQPNYNPHVTSLGFGAFNSTGCTLSSANELTPGELALLGYPTGVAPSEPGGTPLPVSQKITSFSRPYKESSSGELVRFDDRSGSSDLTYFAHVALIKDWELWHLELAYDRSNDDSGSFGASSVQDSFEATVRWTPAELWSVSLIGTYAMIDQASDIAVPTGLVVQNGPVPAGVDSVSQIATVQRVIVKGESNAVSYDTASASLTVSRRLTLNSSAFAAVYWYRQDQHTDLPSGFDVNPAPGSPSGSLNEDTTWHALTFWIGIDWQFDTIKF